MDEISLLHKICNMRNEIEMIKECRPPPSEKDTNTDARFTSSKRKRKWMRFPCCRKSATRETKSK
jgi:hypothetical protein